MKLIYDNLNKVAFWVCLLSSISLMVASFIIPPMGVIDPSVLKGVALLLGFATLGTIIDAVAKGADIKVSHNGTDVTIDNPD